MFSVIVQRMRKVIIYISFCHRGKESSVVKIIIQVNIANFIIIYLACHCKGQLRSYTYLTTCKLQMQKHVKQQLMHLVVIIQQSTLNHHYHCKRHHKQLKMSKYTLRNLLIQMLVILMTIVTKIIMPVLVMMARNHQLPC